jgi:hypothetical protein
MLKRGPKSNWLRPQECEAALRQDLPCLHCIAPKKRAHHNILLTGPIQRSIFPSANEVISGQP